MHELPPITSSQNGTAKGIGAALAKARNKQVTESESSATTPPPARPAHMQVFDEDELVDPEAFAAQQVPQRPAPRPAQLMEVRTTLGDLMRARKQKQKVSESEAAPAPAPIPVTEDLSRPVIQRSPVSGSKLAGAILSSLYGKKQ